MDFFTKDLEVGCEDLFSPHTWPFEHFDGLETGCGDINLDFASMFEDSSQMCVLPEPHCDHELDMPCLEGSDSQPNEFEEFFRSFDPTDQGAEHYMPDVQATQRKLEDTELFGLSFGCHAPAELESNATSSKSSRQSITRQSRKILESYFKVELYPDKKEIETIANKSRLSFKQVRQWFRNKRRRTTPEGMLVI